MKLSGSPALNAMQEASAPPCRPYIHTIDFEKIFVTVAISFSPHVLISRHDLTVL
jgi:hypothetical protein